MTTRKTLSSKSIDSDTIYNQSGDKIGKVKDLMINTKKGTVEYVVVSFGGILGVGDKYFSVPWNLLKIDQHKKQVCLDVDETILKDVEGFDKNNWPDELDKEIEKKWRLISQASDKKSCATQ
ncbi:MAG: photosystem reaction center subunit H [Legionellales bacterium]|nr:photosystem reaction center subunit H [Legionellales bacterium]|tara:strand:- start:1002 stop:1367 length:366 start_codon:yes stop_codon:yes gene_type:complete